MSWIARVSPCWAVKLTWTCTSKLEVGSQHHAGRPLELGQDFACGRGPDGGARLRIAMQIRGRRARSRARSRAGPRPAPIPARGTARRPSRDVGEQGGERRAFRGGRVAYQLALRPRRECAPIALGKPFREEATFRPSGTYQWLAARSQRAPKALAWSLSRKSTLRTVTFTLAKSPYRFGLRRCSDVALVTSI